MSETIGRESHFLIFYREGHSVRRSRLFGSRPDPRRVPPKGLEIVKLAHVRAHDMDDDVEIIENDPRCIYRSVGPAGSEIVIRFELVGDLLEYGAKVRLARAGADDEIVCNVG